MFLNFFFLSEEWSTEILDLCEEYKEKGVVGIDIAGNEFKEENMAKESGMFFFAFIIIFKL